MTSFIVSLVFILLCPVHWSKFGKCLFCIYLHVPFWKFKWMAVIPLMLSAATKTVQNSPRTSHCCFTAVDNLRQSCFFLPKKLHQYCDCLQWLQCRKEQEFIALHKKLLSDRPIIRIGTIIVLSLDYQNQSRYFPTVLADCLIFEINWFKRKQKKATVPCQITIITCLHLQPVAFEMWVCSVTVSRKERQRQHWISV